MQELEQVIEGFRLSPQQRRVWRLQLDSHAYWTQCAILIEGHLESELLEKTLKKILLRHEILRTTLDWFPGLDTPIQMILENPSLPYREVLLSDRRPEEFAKTIDDLFREESRPFDLKRGLLARFCLGRLSTSRHVLLISQHSLCSDSRTLRNLFNEISRFYVAELEGRELSDQPVQYLQFSEWQNELLEEAWQKSDERPHEVNGSVPELLLPLEINP